MTSAKDMPRTHGTRLADENKWDALGASEYASVSHNRVGRIGATGFSNQPRIPMTGIPPSGLGGDET
jgi:hypothetical protein